MHAPTNPAVPLAVIRTAAARLAALLVEHELNVTVGRLGIVEIRNPRDTRMRQPIVFREHQGGMWWHWLWSEDNAPPELEPMCPADDVDEAARRIVNVLAVRT